MWTPGLMTLEPGLEQCKHTLTMSIRSWLVLLHLLQEQLLELELGLLQHLQSTLFNR